MSQNQKSIGWLEVSVAMFFVLAMLTVLWVVLRAPIGFLYHHARLAETGGLWGMTAWGQYFAKVLPKNYAVESIFVSSIPFGVLCAGVIIVIGLFMKYKVEKDHIITHLRPEKPMEWRDLMLRFAPLYPHNEFFANFPMYRYSASDGPASQPMSALELLHSAGAVSFERAATTADDTDAAKPSQRRPLKEDDTGEMRIDVDKVRAALTAHFGPLNPFVNVTEMKNVTDVTKAVNELSWYAATILYAALVRVNALHDPDLPDPDGLKDVVDKSEEYLRDVWRAINAEKRRLGDRLMIGPYDYPDPTKKPAKGNGKAKKAEASDASKDTILLKDHLAKVGPEFKTTLKAREELVKLLVDPAKGLDPKKPAKALETICKSHGYVFGLLASSMTDGRDGMTLEGARASGVFAPNTFLWLRFVDRQLWRFLNYIGMQTPCPEAAGMFDHWQTELALKAPRTEPEIAETTITAVVNEARKQSPRSLTARNFEEMRERIEKSTQEAMANMQAASKAWNDDETPASAILPRE